MHRAPTAAGPAFLIAAGVMLMAMTPVSPVPVPLAGDWGGGQARLHLTEAGGRLDLSCASLTIAAPVRPDAAGRFAGVGRYEDFAGGPTLADRPPQTTPARFTGQVDGTVMQLSVRRAGGTSSEDFTLEMDRRVKLIRCA